METVYLCLVVFLFLLAIFDLVVGVSNDAVNFLNSAIGAKVASFKTIIIVAAIGVFCGAAMSNGMMEIARHGIFHPQFFSFEELMYIFLAVMVTDIILLDIFNSFGMPTSTTVSMVFELLGATFALSLVKIIGDTTGTYSIGELMNTEKALSVIMSIFVSVGIAFVFGILVQYLSRLFFSFNYQKNLTWKIGIFGGIAATSIIYFMLIKGIKDLSFMNADIKAYIHDNTLIIIGGCFVFFTILMQLLHFLKINVFKIIVLMGTFALATAFAGNDLVNFIGVPLAGYASFTDYAANGAGDPSSFLMTSLNEPARTPAIFLFGAGVIMVISLITSKKAYNVVKTSVDLSRQDGGDEMFGSSRLARSLVRMFTNASRFVSDYTPKEVKRWIGTRFNQSEVIIEDGAAFDMVRASINLVLAGLLIALGTSLKLPLSTTYVAFMVAMGTSLADRAWGRESAVFRITGVLSVIGGWFLTAACAFTACFAVVLLMYYGGIVVAILLVLLAVGLLIRSNMNYGKKAEEKQKDDVFQRILRSKNEDETCALMMTHVANNQVNFLAFVCNTYRSLTDGFFNDDIRSLRRVDSLLDNAKKTQKNVRRKEMIAMRKLSLDTAIRKNTWFHLASTSNQQILYCLIRMLEPCKEHVDNNFLPVEGTLVKVYIEIRNHLMQVITRAEEVIDGGHYEQVDDLRNELTQIKEQISHLRKSQMDRMQDSKVNLTTSYVYLNTLQETQELVSNLRHLLRAARYFQTL